MNLRLPTLCVQPELLGPGVVYHNVGLVVFPREGNNCYCALCTFKTLMVTQAGTNHALSHKKKTPHTYHLGYFCWTVYAPTPTTWCCACARTLADGGFSEHVAGDEHKKMAAGWSESASLSTSKKRRVSHVEPLWELPASAHPHFVMPFAIQAHGEATHHPTEQAAHPSSGVHELQAPLSLQTVKKIGKELAHGAMAIQFEDAQSPATILDEFLEKFVAVLANEGALPRLQCVVSKYERSPTRDSLVAGDPSTAMEEASRPEPNPQVFDLSSHGGALAEGAVATFLLRTPVPMTSPDQWQFLELDPFESSPRGTLTLSGAQSPLWSVAGGNREAVEAQRTEVDAVNAARKGDKGKEKMTEEEEDASEGDDHERQMDAVRKLLSSTKLRKERDLTDMVSLGRAISTAFLDYPRFRGEVNSLLGTLNAPAHLRYPADPAKLQEITSMIGKWVAMKRGSFSSAVLDVPLGLMGMIAPSEPRFDDARSSGLVMLQPFEQSAEAYFRPAFIEQWRAFFPLLTTPEGHEVCKALLLLLRTETEWYDSQQDD